MDESAIEEDEYFIRKRDLCELFDSKFDLNINLFRGKNPHNDDSIFYPILKSFLLSNGEVREEDIKTYLFNGDLWVDALSGGISLFDKKGIPSNRWDFMLLAAGAKIPCGLVITKDEYRRRFKATHYTIRPNWDMPLKKYLALLDKLALSLRGA